MKNALWSACSEVNTMTTKLVWGCSHLGYDADPEYSQGLFVRSFG